MAQPEPLNVVALVSGGKDSFYSILHCIANGHRIVALANLYPADSNVGVAEPDIIDPATATSTAAATNSNPDQHDEEQEEHDLNSFMYQTVGHAVIPLYAKALQLPLYRHPIMGSAVTTSSSYSSSGTADDETESLLPLLQLVKEKHPQVNAVCSGAILSTYQRTRVESIVLRLGLVPLAYLWQWPTLPDCEGAALLHDMRAAGLVPRIIKVASAGLDEESLWEELVSIRGVAKIERAMRRFGEVGDGAVLGEGGEFETLVVDGPSKLFKGRILVESQDLTTVREGGGSAWVNVKRAEVVFKEDAGEEKELNVRIPDILETQFEACLRTMGDLDDLGSQLGGMTLQDVAGKIPSVVTYPVTKSDEAGEKLFWTITADSTDQPKSVDAEIAAIVDKTRASLDEGGLDATDILFSTILLRSMNDFGAVNKVYSSLFVQPNPPARVTVACGSALPENTNVVLHLTLSPTLSKQKQALHVQSRSYWAPQNIGPYSQAVSTSFPDAEGNSFSHVQIAGQIPLIPSTMLLPETTPDVRADFRYQSVLALQHLWRIGRTMNVSWWTSVAAYIARDEKIKASERAIIAGRVWRARNSVGRSKLSKANDDEDEDEDVDLWEAKHHAGMREFGGGYGGDSKTLPDWSTATIPKSETGTSSILDDLWDGMPPFFAVEVDELPRGSGVEWHAHSGVAGGKVELHQPLSFAKGTIHRTTVSSRLEQVTIFFRSSSTLEDVVSSLPAEVLELFQTRNAHCVAAYVDSKSHIVDEWELFEKVVKGASSRIIPAFSLWDEYGSRLGAVLVLQMDKGETQ